MSTTTRLIVLISALLCSGSILAKAPASAPAGTTGLCTDGSYSSAAEKSGACSGHGGIKKWYGTTTGSGAAHEGSSSAKSSKSKHEKGSAPAAPAPAASAAATGACKDGTTTTASSKSGACSGHGGVKEWYVAPVAPTAKAVPATPAAPSAPAPRATAPGGGNGQVWVNKDTKVYHCRGDKWYGKTKEGAYMSESSAVAQGYHADHGKACQQ